MKILKLYAPSFSYFGRAVRLLLQYKGLDYELTKAPFGEEIGYFGEAHRQIHPFKKLPVLIDGDYVLAESLAIANYIESHDGPSFTPQPARERAHALALASHLATDAHKHLLSNLILEFAFPKGPDKQIRFAHIEEHLENAKMTLSWIDEQLKRNIQSDETASAHLTARYLYSNQFTVSDALLTPALDYLAQLPEPYNLCELYEHLSAYLDFQRRQPYTQNVLGPAFENLQAYP